MSLKDKLKSLVSGESASPAVAKGTLPAALASDSFPVLRAADVDLSHYTGIPLASLGALGAAFSQLPESARTVVSSIQTTTRTGGKLYVGLWPDGVNGVLRQNGATTLGNIIGGGKNTKYVGRMRFKEVNPSALKTTSSTVMPINPMNMAIAAALANVSQKLDDIRSAVEDVLQFLKLEKQTRQRGNLDALNEIFNEYKQFGEDEKRCMLRNVEVQAIRREAQQDILFYQERIAKVLKENKAVHFSQDAADMRKSAAEDFGEYQLACYLYAFSTLLDLLLQRNFSESVLESAKSKMEAYAARYRQLYEDCAAKISAYHKAGIESQVALNAGNTARWLGNLASSFSPLKETGLGEKLANVGNSIDASSEGSRQRLLNSFAPLGDCRMSPFIDCADALNQFVNLPGSLLTDGETLYLKAGGRAAPAGACCRIGS